MASRTRYRNPPGSIFRVRTGIEHTSNQHQAAQEKCLVSQCVSLVLLLYERQTLYMHTDKPA